MSLESTYKELKQEMISQHRRDFYGLESTYKELKHYSHIPCLRNTYKV